MSKKDKKKLSLLGDDDESSDAGEAEELTINKDYAKRYDNWRRLEELQKLKDKYGDEAVEGEGEDSSSSESEVEWTPEDEKGFLKSLAALKTRNPKIYNAEEKFFQEREGPSSSKEAKKDDKKKEKPQKMFLKDYERKLIVERGGQISEDDEADFKAPVAGGYIAEQDRLKKEFQAALGDSDDDDDDGLLVKREKTEEQQRKEDEDYYAWLKGQGSPKDIDEDIKALKEHWSNDAQLDDGEKFLRNYLVNKQYEMDDDDVDGDAIPTYDQIVSVEQDEADTAREEQFEHKYNYRYEDPDQEFIKQYPRTIKESMRQGNEKRKKERESHKERKEREKAEKKEEIKQLKKMKRTEIEEKLKKLKKMAGDEDLPLNLDDLDEDFDPAKFDKRMKEVFSEKYYDNENVEDEEKPEFSDMSEIDSDGDDNYDDMEISTKPVKVKTEDGEEEEEEEEEDEEEEEEPQEREKKKESRRRRKRNSKFAEAVQKQKPLFDPNEKTFEEYFNEYYSLDYEDILGDTRTKFKYRSVPANSFGLSVDEILETDDKRLNAWVSLKKATMYRSEQEEIFDQRAYERKAQNVEKKQKILSDPKVMKKPKADVGDDNDAEESKPEVKKEQPDEIEEPEGAEEGTSQKKKRRRNKKSKTGGAQVKEEEAKEEEVEEEPQGAEEGSSPKKSRRRNKKPKAGEAQVKQEDVEEGEAPAPEAENEPMETKTEPTEQSANGEKKKRSRKRKHQEGGKGIRRPDELQKISDERLQAYGLNPKKFVNQFHHQKKRRLENQKS